MSKPKVLQDPETIYESAQFLKEEMEKRGLEVTSGRFYQEFAHTLYSLYDRKDLLVSCLVTLRDMVWNEEIPVSDEWLYKLNSCLYATYPINHPERT